MAKRRRDPATTYAAPAGWRLPTEDSPQADHTAGRIDMGATYRGNLSSVEEAEITAGHRPIKSAATEQAEAATRAAHPRSTVRDRYDMAPDKLHTPNIPYLLAEAFVKYLDGDRGLTRQERRIGLVLAELERLRPVLWAAMCARYVHRRTDQEIAAEIFLTDKTAARMVALGTAWVAARLQELYPEVV